MLIEQVISSLRAAADYALEVVTEDGYWCGEVHSNTTFTSQYIFLRQQLGLRFEHGEIATLTRWLLSQQNEDGSWGLSPSCPGDVSTSTETYLALKILGMPKYDPRMISAAAFIVKSGSLPATRMFTRIFLASFGLIPWASLPALPAELVMLPSQFPINIYNLSSWARVVCIPLLIARHHEPIYPLTGCATTSKIFLNELWPKDMSLSLAYAKPLSTLWQRGDYSGMFFTAADKAMSFLGRYFHSPLRTVARRKIVAWILDHQEHSGEWGGYWPAQHNNIWALSLEGYPLDHPVMRRGLEALEGFVRRDASGMRVQVTVSQVWDSALMAIALSDSVSSTAIHCPNKTIDWILKHEISSNRGDWRVYRPHLPAGGFCFEQFNTLYPDVDDSAATVLALIKYSDSSPGNYTAAGCIHRTLRWILGMQNDDGGWGAFDWNNDKLFLNKLPFSDMDSLCDPSTPDVTGRVLECCGVLLRRRDVLMLGDSLAATTQTSCGRGLAYLLKNQQTDGSWWGRWGINYTYGTSNVLCGLADFSSHSDQVRVASAKAVGWMRSHQNPDGGWGESAQSYTDVTLAGCGPTTPTQTAWAIIALLHYSSPDEEVIRQGVTYLVQSQAKLEGEGTASWPQKHYTATGFPEHLYLEYDYYRHYFPMMALGRYARKVSSLSDKPLIQA